MKYTFIGLGAAFLAASPAFAENSSDETWIRLGAFLPNIDTEVSVARPGQEEFATLIDLETDLALTNRDTLPDVSIGTRLGKRWRVEGEYFTLSRGGEKTLSREIIFDDVTYPVSATLSSKFASDVYRLSVGYSFIRNDKAELGVAVGAHVSNFSIRLSGTGSVGGATASTEVRRKEVLAPLPTLGIYGNAEIMPKLNLRGRVDYLSLSIGDYDGRLINVEAGASYSISSKFRVGAMYRRVDYRLDINKDAYTGRIDYGFSGPMLYAELAL